MWHHVALVKIYAKDIAKVSQLSFNQLWTLGLQSQTPPENRFSRSLASKTTLHA